MVGVRVALDNASVKLETMRSRALAEAVRDGRLDFAVVREDSIPDASGKNTLSLVKLTFHLCIPKRLLKQGTTTAALSDPDLWKSLPFAACKDGGQLDVTIREAMRASGVDFRPAVECSSMLQVRQLVERGECAGVLPSLGITGLVSKDTHIVEFTPLKSYGRALVLHWNRRQIDRRGVDLTQVHALAKSLRVSQTQQTAT